MLHDDVLQAAIVAIVRIERVIIVAGKNEVLAVHGATEELDAVIRAVVDLHIVHRRARTDARKADTVELVAWSKRKAGMLQDHVAQRTTVIVSSDTAIDSVRVAHPFNDVVAIECGRCGGIAAAVNGCATQDDEPAPFTDSLGFVDLGACHIGFGCHNDRVFLGAIREDLRTAIDDDVVQPASAEYGHARLDGQGSRVTAGIIAISTDIDADIETSHDFIIVAARQAHIIKNGAGNAADRLIVDRDTGICGACRAARIRE